MCATRVDMNLLTSTFFFIYDFFLIWHGRIFGVANYKYKVRFILMTLTLYLESTTPKTL